MTLNDLRRYAVRNGDPIRFDLSGGLTCLIDAAGIARVPGLDSPPSFRLEDELASAAAFSIGEPPKRLSRDELGRLLGKPPEDEAHDDE